MPDLNPQPVVGVVGARSTAVNNPEHINHRFPIHLGIELELENCNYEEVAIPTGWTVHRDDSLRNGIEFVTDIPRSGGDLLDSIQSFYRSRLRYENTPRCSTHIHINAADLSVKDTRTMLVISYMLEDVLFLHLNAGRKWCGYCMPLSEMAPMRVSALLNAKTNGEFRNALGTHNADKYYGINLRSLQRHGTVEFRYFPGVPDQDTLLSWMDYVTLLYKASKTSSIEELATLNSLDQVEGWLNRYMGVWARTFTGGEHLLTNIFESLQAVLGLISDEFEPNRTDPVIFCTPYVIKYGQRGMTPEQAKWFEQQLSKLEVVSSSDWNYYKAQAWRGNIEETKPQSIGSRELFEASAQTLDRMAMELAATRTAPASRPPRRTASPTTRDTMQMMQQRAQQEAARIADYGRYFTVSTSRPTQIQAEEGDQF